MTGIAGPLFMCYSGSAHLGGSLMVGAYLFHRFLLLPTLQ